MGKQAFCGYDAENQENIISNGYNKKKTVSPLIILQDMKKYHRKI